MFIIYLYALLLIADSKQRPPCLGHDCPELYGPCVDGYCIGNNDDYSENEESSNSPSTECEDIGKGCPFYKTFYSLKGYCPSIVLPFCALSCNACKIK